MQEYGFSLTVFPCIQTESFSVLQKKIIDKKSNGKNVPSPEVVEIVLIQCNLLDNQYQQKSEVLYTFAPNKSSGFLLM